VLDSLQPRSRLYMLAKRPAAIGQRQRAQVLAAHFARTPRTVRRHRPAACSKTGVVTSRATLPSALRAQGPPDVIAPAANRCKSCKSVGKKRVKLWFTPSSENGKSTPRPSAKSVGMP